MVSKQEKRQKQIQTSRRYSQTVYFESTMLHNTGDYKKEFLELNNNFHCAEPSLLRFWS